MVHAIQVTPPPKIQDGTFQESIHFQSPSHSSLGRKSPQVFLARRLGARGDLGPGMESIERQMVALVLWVTAIHKTEGARRKEINILEFGILGHPDFLPLLKNADVFFWIFGYRIFFGPYVLKVEVVQWLSPKSHETTTLQVGLPCSPFCDRQVLALAGKDWDRKISPNELANETLIGWLILILVWGW